MRNRQVSAPGRAHCSSLRQVLDRADLPAVVPRLAPRVLQRLVRAVGLEDAGELISFATPAQLVQVFDADLWRREDRAAPGELFDAGRFGLWLQVLVEGGVETAADKLAALAPAFVATALSQHLAVSSPRMADSRGLLERHTTFDLGGIVIVARRLEAWDAIVLLLTHLHAERPQFFHELMSACRDLSFEFLDEESGFDNLLTSRQQALADLAFERERRLEQQGYVTRARALAFLQGARRVRLTDPFLPHDPIAAGYFRDEAGGIDAVELNAEEARRTGVDDDADLSVAARDIAAILTVVSELEPQARAVRGLLGPAPDQATPAAPLVDAYFSAIEASDRGRHDRAVAELGFLANALLDGAVLRDRAITEREAADLALGTCNLGLECWPAHWPEHPGTAPRAGGLVDAFRVGWAVLHEQVCLATARQLARVLEQVPGQTSDAHADIIVLRRALTRAVDNECPWEASPHMDVIAILDTPAWATLLLLIGECPVMPEGSMRAGIERPRRIGHGFECIASRLHLAWVAGFLERLPSLLAG